MPTTRCSPSRPWWTRRLGDVVWTSLGGRGWHRGAERRVGQSAEASAPPARRRVLARRLAAIVAPLLLLLLAAPPTSAAPQSRPAIPRVPAPSAPASATERPATAPTAPPASSAPAPISATSFLNSPQEQADLLDRPISRVVFVGLSRLTESDLRPNIRVAPGQPFDPATIREDVNTLYRLGQFRTVTAQARLESDGTVSVEYTVIEQKLIAAVQVVGNKVISDQELRAVIPLFANAPRDDFLVEQSVRDIKNLYRLRGHYLVDVLVDESRLDQEGVLIFRIVEGPRVRIRAIVFEGNDSFPSQELAREAKTKAFIPFFRKGQLDEDQLLDDVATISKFYRDRGYVDVRVDRRIELSPDNREAQVVFVVAEGRQYRVRRIDVFGGAAIDGRPLNVFAPEQIVAMLPIQSGDVYSQDLMRKAVRTVEDAYGMMGYVDTQVDEAAVRVGEEPLVDLLVRIREGEYSMTGLVRIQGNFLTKDKVIRREVRLQPGRPLDARELVEAEDRLRRTRLFGEPIRIAVQDPEPDAALAGGGLPDQIDEEAGRLRDVLLEIRERNTGSVNFGVAVGTDSGLFGEVSIRQDNFDIADPPESFSELVTGRAFRGAGQKFLLSIAPGIDISTFSLSLGEPRLFDSEVGGNLSTFYRIRNFDNYIEDRLNFSGSLGVRLGDVWNANVFARYENIELTDIELGSPVEVFEDAGPSWISGLGLRVQRNTLDRQIRPSRGSVFSASFEQVGALGGDYTFPTLRGEYSIFFTVNEDFLGRRSILRLRTEAAYIFNDEAPVYEKYYLGGRSFRGFEFRTISPKGVNVLGQQTTDPIGGNWLFFVGAQYEVPIFGEFLSGVLFVDSGTVTDDLGFDDYRVSVGTGIRVYIPAFGPVPFAFDVAWPLVKQELDQEQVFSFSAELPF